MIFFTIKTKKTMDLKKINYEKRKQKKAQEILYKFQKGFFDNIYLYKNGKLIIDSFKPEFMNHQLYLKILKLANVYEIDLYTFPFYCTDNLIQLHFYTKKELVNKFPFMEKFIEEYSSSNILDKRIKFYKVSKKSENYELNIYFDFKSYKELYDMTFL